MSKLGKELMAKGIEPVTNSDGRRIQCPNCRSKGLEDKGKHVECHACEHTFKR